MPLNNFGLVDRRQGGAALYRCAQPDLDGKMYLAGCGVPRVYCLNPADGVRPWPSGISEILNCDIGMTAQVATVVEIAAQMAADLDSGTSLVVHCRRGIDRTGEIVGAYRLRHCGWTYEDMERERRNYGAGVIGDLVLDAVIVERLKQIAHMEPYKTTQVTP